MDGLDEPLALSAPIARRLAPSLCRRDPATGDSCAWNHGLWQILRLLGLVVTPVHHAEFFRDALFALTDPGRPIRILVSGSADYAMLAQVLCAARAQREALQVTVLDVCETPLMLNRWYAEHASCPVQTACSDILDYEPAEQFDAVCTHSFLAMFPHERRPDLLAKWSELLRPGGVAITVNRLRPGYSAGHAGFSAEEARTYGDLVRARAAALPAALQLEPGQLALEAATYASRLRTYPLASAGELRTLFEHAGFRPDHVSCAPIARDAQLAVAAPTVPGGADYARIIATRL